MIPTFLQVALGGAIGAAARYGVGRLMFRPGDGLPLGVITVNILGSFLMGVFIVWAARKGGAPLGPFLATGVLGGFTTFSAFSLEFANLVEKGATGQAAAYLALNVVGALAAIFAGLWVARGVL